jgi:CHAD domain-containing protein
MVINSNEFKIKLLFPKNKFEVIEQWIISKGAVRRQHLQDAYIDTPDLLLIQAGVTFFLRKERRHRIQTLKVVADNSLERLEHDVVRKVNSNIAPNWDLDLHCESGRLLKGRLPKLKVQELQICYQTDIWRRKAVIKSRHGVIQYALDKGSISSLLPNETRKAPIQVLDIELIEGDPRNVLKHAQKLIKSYGAFIDTRSKSECSFLLANRLDYSAPVKSKHVALKSAGDNYEIISRLIHSCMEQVLTNQSVLNLECQNYSEYLHQLRIGLRRLKVLFKYLKKYEIHISDKGIEILNRVFRIFGQYRNNDYVTNVLNPTLLSLGGSEIKLGDIVGLSNPAHITRDKDFQLLLIELMSLGLSQSAPMVRPVADKKNNEGAVIIRKTVTKKLDRRFQFITDQAAKFSDLRDEEIHLLRKKMKFIRYSVEFFKDFCNKKVYPNFYKTITTTIDNFGLFNDICVTIDRFEGSAQTDPNLLFALSWLKFKRKRVRNLCEKSLKKLMHTPIPWES